MKSKSPWKVAFITPLLLSLPLMAQTSSPTGSTSAEKSGNRPIPFHGMVSAVDQTKKTFTISGKEATRVFKVTDRTKILKGAGTASMKDIVENQEASGAYWKHPDGSLEAKLVKLGPAAKPSPTAKP